MKARLFRAGLQFDAALDGVPDNPDPLTSFGMGDAQVSAHISPCTTSSPLAKFEDRRRVSLSVAGLSDDDGVVLSLNVNVYSKDGEWLYAITAPLVEADVQRLGSAIDAAIKLTPKAPQK